MTVEHLINPIADKKTRYTIDMNAEARAKLGEVSKKYKITQGEVIEVMLAELLGAETALDTAFLRKREDKISTRAPKKEIIQRFRNMTPAQLEAALKAAAAVAS